METRTDNGCSIEGKTSEGHFKSISQGDIFLKDGRNPTLEKKAPMGNMTIWQEAFPTSIESIS